MSVVQGVRQRAPSVALRLPSASLLQQAGYCLPSPKPFLVCTAAIEAVCSAPHCNLRLRGGSSHLSCACVLLHVDGASFVPPVCLCWMPTGHYGSLVVDTGWLGVRHQSWCAPKGGLVEQRQRISYRVCMAKGLVCRYAAVAEHTTGMLSCLQDPADGVKNSPCARVKQLQELATSRPIAGGVALIGAIGGRWCSPPAAQCGHNQQTYKCCSANCTPRQQTRTCERPCSLPSQRDNPARFPWGCQPLHTPSQAW